MENQKYNSQDLTEVATKLYHAVTGIKPDGPVKERIQAGVEALVKLYETNPELLYALGNAAATPLDLQLEKYTGMKSDYELFKMFLRCLGQLYNPDKKDSDKITH